MGVIAIRRNDVIIRPGGRDRAGDDRFLSDIEMTKSADFLRLILLARALFKAADQQHRREHLDFVALPGQRHRDQCGSGRAAAARQRGFAPTPAHAGNEKQREEQVAHNRVAEEHPGRGRAVLRQADGKRLDEAAEIFDVTRIGQPGKRVGDRVKENRPGKRSRQDRLERRPPADGEPEQSNKRKGNVATENQGI